MALKIMGILNVTPDSFSDGGKHFETEAAIEAAHDLVAHGADLVDVGGESTRPTSERITAQEEVRRIDNVLIALVGAHITVSVDTLHAHTARVAIERGVDIINDVSGGCFDADMPHVIANSDVTFICQHWRTTPDKMDGATDYDHYGGVVPGVIAELENQINALMKAGVRREQVIIDPGLGFAKTAAQSWQLLMNIDALATHFSLPVLVGHSRKRFLDEVCVGNWKMNRDQASAYISGWCANHNVWAVRVHNVAASATAVATATKLMA